MSQLDAHGQARPPGDPPTSHAAAGRGVPLFRIFGIQIRLDWTWMIIFFVMVYMLRDYFRPALEGQPEWAVWLLSAVSVIALFVCVLAHEIGHSLVAIRHGIRMYDITLFIFGGMARLRGEPRRPGDELKIALAGPAVTVVLAGIFWGVWAGLADRVGIVVGEGLHYLAVINTMLLVFNLLPGFPLDGGRVLRAILWHVRGNLFSATRTAARVGKGFGFLLIAVGVLILVQAQFGEKKEIAVAGMFNVFIGWFLAKAANESVQHVQVRSVLEAFHVADAMQRNVVTVSADLPLDRLVADGFHHYHFKSFPVVDGGVFRGLVSLPDAHNVPPHLWAATAVARITPPQSAQLAIHADDGLYEAFRRMGEDDLARLVVTDHAGRVVGLIGRRDVMWFLQTYSGLQPAGIAPPRQAIPLPDPPDATAAAGPSARGGPPPSLDGH